MQRIADYIGPHIWNQNLVYIDDFLLAFASMKMTKNIVTIGEIGYYHFVDKLLVLRAMFGKLREMGLNIQIKLIKK